MKSPNPPTDDVSLMSHFIELRGRFIRIFLAVLVVFLALVGFSRELYDLISNPLVALLPTFAYFIVLVPALKFFVVFAPDNVLPMTDIDSYLNFVIKLLLVFGVMFEIPVVTLILVLMRLVSIASLTNKRRYIIVGCFAVAAVITPPDGASMLMLAIPMCLLFELGLIMAKLLVKTPKAP